MPEFEACQALEMLIWKGTERDAITAHTLRVIAHTGGMIMGGYEGDKLVAMAIAFATQTPTCLWSHIVGVHPDYQSRGMGYAIKQEQRRWALANEYTQMRWTFDPARRRNAHFNFHLLGAYSARYHDHFYGDMQDALNRNVPSDRLEAVWDLEPTTRLPTLPGEIASLLHCEQDHPQIAGIAHAAYHTVAIPYDYDAIKARDNELAVAWRVAMRAVLHPAFDAGYRLIDFVTDHDQRACHYLLAR